MAAFVRRLRHARRWRILLREALGRWWIARESQNAPAPACASDRLLTIRNRVQTGICPSWRQDAERRHTIGRLDGGPAQQPEAAQELTKDGHPPVFAAGCRAASHNRPPGWRPRAAAGGCSSADEGRASDRLCGRMPSGVTQSAAWMAAPRSSRRLLKRTPTRCRWFACIRT